MRERRGLEESAWHEAGHTVAAVILGTRDIAWVVLRAEIDGTGSGGFVSSSSIKAHAGPRGARRRKRRRVSRSMRDLGAKHRAEAGLLFHAWAIEGYAGAAAQDPRDCGGWASSALLDGCRTDRAQLQEFARMLGWTRRDFCSAYLRLAREFVDRHWGAVRVVAEALLERVGPGKDSVLSGEEVRGLIATAPRERNPWRQREWTNRYYLEEGLKKTRELKRRVAATATPRAQRPSVVVHPRP